MRWLMLRRRRRVSVSTTTPGANRRQRKAVHVAAARLHPADLIIRGGSGERRTARKGFCTRGWIDAWAWMAPPIISTSSSNSSVCRLVGWLAAGWLARWGSSSSSSLAPKTNRPILLAAAHQLGMKPLDVVRVRVCELTFLAAAFGFSLLSKASESPPDTSEESEESDSPCQADVCLFVCLRLSGGAALWTTFDW